MQRVLLYSVPYFINSTNSLYTYTPDQEPIHLGTYDSTTESIVFKSGIEKTLQPMLNKWRETLISKPRKVTGGNKDKADSGDNSEAESDTSD